MKLEILKQRKPNTAALLTGLFLIVVILFYLIIGGDARFEVHDDLDLFPSQYMILKNTGTFFAQDVTVPFLGGIDRDFLPSELSLVALLYMIFPGLAAHVAMYVCKVLIAVVSMYLLAYEIIVNGDWLTATDIVSRKTVKANADTKQRIFSDMQNRILFSALAYGMVNLFPHFGIAFASIPLVVFLFCRINRFSTVKEARFWYAPLFLYPFVSYFSYFGFFILAYLAAALVFLWIRAFFRRNKERDSEEWEQGEAYKARYPVTLTVALPVLCAGYMVFEYRLFKLMLFSDVPTIRDTMSQVDFSFGEALGIAWDLFLNGNMHTTSVHKFFVMPVCVIYILLIIIRYFGMRKMPEAEPLQLPHRVLLACFALVVLNCLIGGLGSWSFLRHILEGAFPVLNGFQFNRTYFFNPFLWYLMLGVLACSAGRRIGTTLACIACAVALIVPVPYNSLFFSAYEQYYRANHDGAPTDNLTYGDFYATELFEYVKEDMGYDTRDYAAAYGFYPAVLQYNGISTIDGYLGYYPLAYKALFRKAIAPALDRMEVHRDYFDRFGGRCQLYSGTDESMGMQFRSMPGLTDTDIHVDTKALLDLGCRYIFSRVKLTNADGKGLLLAHSYEDAGGPFPVYVYIVQ